MTKERTRPPDPTEPEHDEAHRPQGESPLSATLAAPAPSVTESNGASNGMASNGAAGNVMAGMAGMGGVRGTAAPPSGQPGAAPGTVSPTGSGQDVRHRGWYWHWNTLITQYAPLLGLKGVGLLNSYTVWTDRREGSPHQGYAFPAQESEAHFYGEGREELIALNKLLVALDLIEIHKEMVLRQDARGRRWRVPHNFYRVKDPRDGLVLSLPAVVRVLELARRDRNAFRHIRHVFGPQFAPIDRTSLWHVLLPQLRELPLWQELAAQAARERRVPRKAARPEDAAIAASDAATGEALSASDALVSGVVPHPEGDPTTRSDTDEVRTFSTFPADSTVGHGDKAALQGDNQSLWGRDSSRRTYAVAHSDAENPLSAPEGADVGAGDAEGHSTHDEGSMNIEGASTSIVRRDDGMYYQEGESKEETTRTSSTSESLRARAHTRGERRDPERGRPRPPDAEAFHGEGEANGDEAAPDVSQGQERKQPERPAVSDLFTAMAERTRHAQGEAENWYQRANLPAAAEVWEHGRTGDDIPRIEPPEDTTVPADNTATPGTDTGTVGVPGATDTDTAAATEATGTPFDPHDLPDPDTAPGQPLPPAPGEGSIVVRALDVREVGTPDTAQAAQLGEIETALTMANGRSPSDMELSLLWRVAQDCDAVARTGPGPGNGLGWVIAAIWEAVNSGSEFVAPKRVAAICDRWASEGFMSDGRATPAASAPRALQDPPPRPDAPAPAPAPESAPEERPDSPPAAAAESAKGAEPEVPVPEEEGLRLWAGVLRRLDGVLHADALGSRTFTAARIAATAGERVTVQAHDGESAARLGTYRGLIARRLSDVLGRAVADVRFVGADDIPASGTAPTPQPAMGSGPLPAVAPVPAPAPVRGEQPVQPVPAPALAPAAALDPVVPPTIPTFTVPGTTQTNGELWAHALHTLRGGVSEATFKVWLQSTALIAADADGTLVIGARNRVQRERLERQHTGEIAAALGDLTGQTVAVRVAVIGTPEGGAR